MCFSAYYFDNKVSMYMHWNPYTYTVKLDCFQGRVRGSVANISQLAGYESEMTQESLTNMVAVSSSPAPACFLSRGGLWGFYGHSPVSSNHISEVRGISEIYLSAG